jgi:hypothetical protein
MKEGDLYLKTHPFLSIQGGSLNGPPFFKPMGAQVPYIKWYNPFI